MVSRAEGTEAEIWASHPDDCLLVKQEHVQISTVETLKATFDVSIMYRINEPLRTWQDDWNRAMSHLLSTFHPRLLYIDFNERKYVKQQNSTMNVPEGGTYSLVWTKKHDGLVLFRYVSITAF